jgi:hypothetical protein
MVDYGLGFPTDGDDEEGEQDEGEGAATTSAPLPYQPPTPTAIQTPPSVRVFPPTETVSIRSRSRSPAPSSSKPQEPKMSPIARQHDDDHNHVIIVDNWKVDGWNEPLSMSISSSRHQKHTTEQQNLVCILLRYVTI